MVACNDALSLNDGFVVEDDLICLRELEFKGVGLIATKEIPRGRRIFVEQPLFVLRMILSVSSLEEGHFSEHESVLLQEVNSLASHRLSAFWNLHDAFAKEQKSACGIVLTNAVSLMNVPLGSVAASEHKSATLGVFDVFSRMNHSCAPNVHWTWQPTSQRLVVHALRNIQAEEELTITYDVTSLFCTSAVRQAKFLRRWRFTCSCSACMLSEEKQTTSDGRRESLCILALAMDQIVTPSAAEGADFGVISSDTESAKGLGIVKKFNMLLDLELDGRPPAKAAALFFGYSLAHRTGNLDLAARMLRSAHRQSLLAEGEDGSRTEQLAKLLASGAA